MLPPRVNAFRSLSFRDIANGSARMRGPMTDYAMGPESITTTGSMDSGTDPSGHPGMTALLELPRAGAGFGGHGTKALVRLI